MSLDEELPSISGCPSNITQSADAGSVTTSVNWTVPLFTDNAGFVSVVDSHQPLNIFYVGTAEVSYTGVDPQGNEDFCIFQVTVVGELLYYYMMIQIWDTFKTHISTTQDVQGAPGSASLPILALPAFKELMSTGTHLKMYPLDHDTFTCTFKAIFIAYL